MRNQGDAWHLTIETLKRELETLVLAPDEPQSTLAEVFAPYLTYASVLGRRTGEMHLALATPTEDADFAAEPFADADARAVADDARAQAKRAFAALRRLDSAATAGAEAATRALLEREKQCLQAIADLAHAPVGAIKTRVHGDYHLGQVLIVQNDVMIVDFEGEPSRPAEERRGKSSPLRDVAGMLRSFAYAAETGRRDILQRFADAGERAGAVTGEWHALTRDAFLAAYAEATAGHAVWIDDGEARARMLRLHLLAKALYEINYEADNRPAWIETPIRGVLSILDEGSA